jgi:hypothetical protein
VRDGRFVVDEGQGSKVGTVSLDLKPRDIQRPNDANAVVQTLLDRQQAGVGQPGAALIDQRGHFVFYSISVSRNLLDFLRHNNASLDLTDTSVLQNIRKGNTMEAKAYQELSLDDRKYPAGIVEYKAAWMIVDSPEAAPNYFVTAAMIPKYVVSNGQLTQPKGSDGQPASRKAYVALIALHVVFTLPGHPEMIWSTFEHVSLDEKPGVITATRDNAPAAPNNPMTPPVTGGVNPNSFPLFLGGTSYEQGNRPSDEKSWASHWDDATQSLTRNGLVQTSVYRPYPASKRAEEKEDDEIVEINENATKMFVAAHKLGLLAMADKREFYRLVGAVWVDQPLADFAKDRKFQDLDSQKALQGEDRLGSTAMESFTESEDAAPGCFNCHDGSVVRTLNGRIFPGSKMNVTHAISKYVDLLPRPSP